MTVVAILADPPLEGLVLPELGASTPLSPSEAAELYVGSLQDVVSAVVASGGEPLVNYRPDDLLPAPHGDPTVSSETAVRSVLSDVVDPAELRFEPQVGSTVSARVGNTITHLLNEEGATTAAVVRPTVPLIRRVHIDEAAMKLRRSPVVLGPDGGQGIFYAGFATPIDFQDAITVPELETLTARGRDADRAVDYLPTLPTITTRWGLLGTVAQVRARTRADRPIPAQTARVIDDLDLRVVPDDGHPRLGRS